jgi:hypothetical protein
MIVSYREEGVAITNADQWPTYLKQEAEKLKTESYFSMDQIRKILTSRATAILRNRFNPTHYVETLLNHHYIELSVFTKKAIAIYENFFNPHSCEYLSLQTHTHVVNNKNDTLNVFIGSSSQKHKIIFDLLYSNFHSMAHYISGKTISDPHELLLLKTYRTQIFGVKKARWINNALAYLVTTKIFKEVLSRIKSQNKSKSFIRLLCEYFHDEIENKTIQKKMMREGQIMKYGNYHAEVDAHLRMEIETDAFKHIVLREGLRFLHTLQYQDVDKKILHFIDHGYQGAQTLLLIGALTYLLNINNPEDHFLITLLSPNRDLEIIPDTLRSHYIDEKFLDYFENFLLITTRDAGFIENSETIFQSSSVRERLLSDLSLMLISNEINPRFSSSKQASNRQS